MAYGELEPIVRFFECSGLLINCKSSAMELMLRTFFPFLCRNWNSCAMKRQGLVVFVGVHLEILGWRLVPMVLCL